MMFYKDVTYQIEDIKGKSCSLMSGTAVYPKKEDIYYAKGGGGGSAPPAPQAVIQNTAPWQPQGEHLAGIMQQARLNFYNEANPYAPFAQQTRDALRLAEARARGGSDVTRAMQSQVQRTLGGDYLFGGPAFNAAVEAAQRQVMPQITSQFARGGRSGSGLASTAQAQALGDVFAKQYAQERQNQMRAMMFAPQAAQADYEDIAKLAAVGGQLEGEAQRTIDAPMERLRRYAAFVGTPIMATSGNLYGGPGGGGGGFSGAGALGGGLGGASLAGMIGGGPIGMGLGALGGGLLGGFF